MESHLQNGGQVQTLRRSPKPRLLALLVLLFFLFCAHPGSAQSQGMLGAQSTAPPSVVDLVQQYVQTLEDCRGRHDRQCEADTLNSIGGVYFTRGYPQIALEYFNQALAIAQEVQNRQGEAAILSNIGTLYRTLGQGQKALEYLNQALPIMQKGDNRKGEAATLNSIGGVYFTLGQPQRALEYFGQALSLRIKVGDYNGEGVTLNNIGEVYNTLWQKQTALKYFKRAWFIHHEVGDRKGEAITLNNIGSVYDDLGEKEKAIEHYELGLSIRGEVGDRLGEAVTLNNLGSVYVYLGQNQKGLEYYKQSLTIMQEVGYRAGEATALNNIGRVYFTLDDDQKALDYYNQALPIAIELEDPLMQGGVLANLEASWQKAEIAAVAIFFGKQAVNAYQQVRGEIRRLDKDLQRSFALSISDAYRMLADLLITQGALAEAREVLDLIKDQEYREYTRGGPDSSTSPASLTSREQTAQARYKDLADNIATIARQWSDLNRKSSRTPEDNAHLAALGKRLKEANQKLADFFGQLYVALGANEPSNRTVEKAKDETAALQARIRKLGPGTIAIYTLVTLNRYWAIVITPDVMVARGYPISAKDLRRSVFALTEDLRDRHSSPLPRAQDLYKILIGPIENDLKEAKAQTLVWSLDDVLRYLPVAALHDGKQYLVERYRNVMITPASSPYLDGQPDTKHLSGLAMGISKKYDPTLDELPAVPAELKAIVHDAQVPDSKNGVLAGLIQLDDKFTAKTLAQRLSGNPPYPLIHIASHFVFKPGNDTTSYLLLAGKEAGGGTGYRLTIEELRDDPGLRFDGTELLTLSACSTAAGGTEANGREVDGLGMLVQRKGAKAVLASLWNVNDASTGQLMADFYRRWITTTGMTKLEALRQAQLDLLRPEQTASAGNSAAATAYLHPYYWAPFVLMGNWQ